MRYAVTVETPVGLMILAEEEGALARVYLPDECAAPELVFRETDCLREAARQFGAFFDGTVSAFDLPLRMRGTPFQQAVWRAISEIPYGQTRAYVDVARAIGQPNAARAVGGACHKNPLPIVVPCHRVISAGGGIGGYGGGLSVKRALLQMEGIAL